MDTYRLFPDNILALNPRIFTASESNLNCSGKFSAVVAEETLVIPYRVYTDCNENIYHVYEDFQPVVAACYFSRHNDGFVREGSLHFLLNSENMQDFALPYILKLAEEYVVELAEIIINKFELLPKCMLENFVRENAQWPQRMYQRSTSYWNCYYRNRYKRLGDYPGIIISNKLKEIATKRYRYHFVCGPVPIPERESKSGLSRNHKANYEP